METKFPEFAAVIYIVGSQIRWKTNRGKGVYAPLSRAHT